VNLGKIVIDSYIYVFTHTHTHIHNCARIQNMIRKYFLFTLILLCNIYFGCVIYEVYRFSKLYIVKTVAINSPKKNIILLVTDLNNESQR